MTPNADSVRGSRRLLLGATVLLAAVCGPAPASHAAQSVSTDLTRTSSPAANGKFAAWLAYSRCMRSHGMPNFPDPTQVAGGGIQISGSRSGINPNSPLYQSTQQACSRLLPNGGRPAAADQQRELTWMRHASHCMRAHGFPGFPDPTLSAPSNRAAYSTIMSNDGVWLAIPSSVDVRSPLFDRAAAACDLGLSQ